MFDFAIPRTHSRPSLTPMIDVVFLLLIFFMLVARFGMDQAVPIRGASGGADYSGPPRLVDVAPDGLRLNGVAMAPQPLMVELVRLTESGDDVVVLRPADGATLQRLLDVMELLGIAGFSNLSVLEAAK